MLGYIILGALAAFGLLCAVWAMFGWLLPGGQGGVHLIFCRPGGKEAQGIARCCWLREMGLMRGPLLVVGSTLPLREQARICGRYKNVEFCEPEALAARLELERHGLDRNGNGDPPRRHCRGGISEL